MLLPVLEVVAADCPENWRFGNSVRAWQLNSLLSSGKLFISFLVSCPVGTSRPSLERPL